MGVKDAIPGIAEMMELESDPWGRMGLAVDLARLGDQRGLNILQRFCWDEAASMTLRLTVADRLRTVLNAESCPELVLQELKSPELEYRNYALSIIPHFDELSPNKSPGVQTLLISSLSDPSPAIRVQAANAIDQSGDISAISALQEAIARESDAGIRDVMSSSLKSLRAKQRSAASAPK